MNITRTVLKQWAGRAPLGSLLQHFSSYYSKYALLIIHHSLDMFTLINYHRLMIIMEIIICWLSTEHQTRGLVSTAVFLCLFLIIVLS